jgi:hypothetical protein
LQAQDMKLSWNEESKTHRALNLTKNWYQVQIGKNRGRGPRFYQFD